MISALVKMIPNTIPNIKNLIFFMIMNSLTVEVTGES